MNPLRLIGLGIAGAIATAIVILPFIILWEGIGLVSRRKAKVYKEASP